MSQPIEHLLQDLISHLKAVRVGVTAGVQYSVDADLLDVAISDLEKVDAEIAVLRSRVITLKHTNEALVGQHDKDRTALDELEHRYASVCSELAFK